MLMWGTQKENKSCHFYGNKIVVLRNHPNGVVEKFYFYLSEVEGRVVCGLSMALEGCIPD